MDRRFDLKPRVYILYACVIYVCVVFVVGVEIYLLMCDELNVYIYKCTKIKRTTTYNKHTHTPHLMPLPPVKTAERGRPTVVSFS